MLRLALRLAGKSHATLQTSDLATSCPGVPFVMRWKNRDPWPIGFQDQFLLAVERQKRNNRKSR